MAELLKGKAVADALTEKTEAMVAELEKKGKKTVLAILRVGENPSDLAYERGACKRAEKTGVETVKTVLEESASTEDVLREVERLNRDDSVDGVLIFRPMPAHIDDDKVRNALDPEKDMDGIGDLAMAGVYSGKDLGYAPCTAEACMEILKHYNVPLKGKKAVVIGRSLVIGRPAAMMLMKENATVTICHTKTENMPEHGRAADILVAAAGKAGVVDGSFMHDNQVIIDVGINVAEDGSMCGDVNARDAEALSGAYTPVPGGVGAVTTSVLMRHVVLAAMKKTGTADK